MKNVVSIVFIFLFAAATAFAEPTVGFNPDAGRVAVGDSVSLDLVMSDFPNCEGGGVTLQFDPSVVQVISVTVNTAAWTFASSPGQIDNAAGKVSDIWFSSFSGASGDGVIATIQVQAVKAGKTGLSLEESALNPFASSGNRLSVTLQDGLLRVGGKKGGGKTK